jgi:hypothetical protein
VNTGFRLLVVLRIFHPFLLEHVEVVQIHVRKV